MPRNRRQFLLSLGSVASAYCHSTYSAPPTPTIEDIFDFVVVGSAAGAVVAVRLLEAGFSVAVIEAGGQHESDNYRIPAFHLKSSEDPTYNWNFYVQHYTARNLHGRRYVNDKGGMLYPRASTLGGCTAHHAMLALLPEPRDWQHISDVSHDKSWSPSFMQRYEKKVREWLPIEQTSPALLLKDHTLSRVITAATLETGTPSRLLQMLPNFNPGHIDTLNKFGLDPNANPHLEGLFMVPQTTRDGRRYGTRERLKEAQTRFPSKLKIFTETLATKVLMTEHGASGKRRAAGVETLTGSHLYRADPLARDRNTATLPGRRQVIRARHEVILAGGAFNSPQLLQLSGIGPAGLLKEHGIKQCIDLPGVGMNLQDRYEVSVVTEFDKRHDILANCSFGGIDDPCLAAYDSEQANRVYASNGLLVGIKKRPTQSPSPEMFIFGSPSHFEGYEPGFSKKAVATGSAFTWAILKGYTENTSGTVQIKSSDPSETPNINFRYFDDGRGGEDDLRAVREGIDLARKINKRSRGMAWFDGRRDKELVPGENIRGKAALNQFIRREAWGHHASCSNKIGSNEDPYAVVDSQCKVFGSSNLRVVDASVFPRIPGLFIVLPLYILAEKIAEDIVNHYRRGA